MQNRTCPTCHATIPANAPGGFCPACLLRDAEEPSNTDHSAPPLEEIAAAFPQWEVLELIGQGGMGFVYKVRQPSLDRIVALKILSPELGRDPAFAERFSREARTLGKLHHPNIVTVFEHGEKEGFFYLLMEYVDGVNLRQAMRAGRFTPEQALAIVPGICDALQAAHAQGIWHRDIKPENILLDREGKVKIADFGIARIVGDPHRDFTLTRTGNALGSTNYMAPEQQEKPHEVDHRADIYSLGVVIYEMLTGELPLGRFPAPSQRTSVDARIDEIVFKTLEKERELRQQSATEVKTDMHRAMQPGATGKARSEKPATSQKAGLARLSFGLFLAGFLAFPLIAAFAPVPAIVAIVSALALLLLAFVFGLASWPELLAKIVVITTGTLFVIGLGFMVARVVVVVGLQNSSRLKQQIESTPAEANAQSQPLPEYDFATPKNAMESMIKAAKKGDVEAFKRGISSDLMEMMNAETSDWSEPMRDFAKLRFGYQKSMEGDVATVLMNGTTPEESLLKLVRENGDWKLAPPARDVTAESPRAAMEEFIRAAIAKDKQAMRRRCSRSLIAIVDDDGGLDETFAQFSRSRVIREKLIDPSNAEVTLESDDNPMKSTFRMVMEDGMWKLTENVVQHN